MDVTINGCRLNVEVLGPGGRARAHRPPRRRGHRLARRAAGDLRPAGRPVPGHRLRRPRLRAVSEGIPPYSHEQWAADVEGLREWAGAEQIVVAGGSYGGFIALEYAVRYPGRVSAIVLRDTSADGSNLELAFENARNQDRVEIDWERFNRYWHGEIRDDADLKAAAGRS